MDATTTTPDFDARRKHLRALGLYGLAVQEDTVLATERRLGKHRLASRAGDQHVAVGDGHGPCFKV